jgi:hypothetical protein
VEFQDNKLKDEDLKKLTIYSGLKNIKFGGNQVKEIESLAVLVRAYANPLLIERTERPEEPGPRRQPHSSEGRVYEESARNAAISRGNIFCR